MADRAYDHPELYEQAFAWRDYAAEAAVVRELWRRHGRGPLGTVLELASGSAPHAGPLTAAGCRYLALDLSMAMLRAARAGDRAPLALRADLGRPPLATGSVDLCMVLLGSLYLADEAELPRHLDAIADLVRPDGCYLLDWCVLFDAIERHEDDWTVDGSKGRAHVSYRCRWADESAGLIEERLVIRRRDTVVRESTVSWAITAERFLPAVEAHPAWELAGCWEDWNPYRPLVHGPDADRPLVLLRRR